MTQPSGRRRNVVPLIAAAVAGVLLILGIRYFTSSGDEPAGPATPSTAAPNSQIQAPRDGCTTVNVAASSEKAALMGQIANAYRESGRTVDGACFDVEVALGRHPAPRRRISPRAGTRR